MRGLHAHEPCATVQEDGFVVLCNLSGVRTRPWLTFAPVPFTSLSAPCPYPPPRARSQLLAPPPPLPMAGGRGRRR